jgi:hypothetical protein
MENFPDQCLTFPVHLSIHIPDLAASGTKLTFDSMTYAPASPNGPEVRSTFGRLLALVLALWGVIAFYAWAASPSQPVFGALDGGNSYYSLLVKGFQSGHLSLAVETPPGLLKVKDPYDPKENAPFGMHDVSFYKGKFYLYFGVTPALVLYWPLAAVSGYFLNDTQAAFLFSTLGFLASSLVLLKIRRAYFPGFGGAADVGGVLAAGLITMVPVMLRRTQVYEVAVSSAYAFFALYLLAVYQSMHSSRRLSWLAVAGLSYGLVIGSRPTYLFGAVSLLLPVFVDLRHDRRQGAAPGSGILARVLAAFVPLALVGMGLMAYNYLRFGSPLEFGQKLALSGSDEMKVTHFSLSYVWFNCHAYLFAPAQLSSYFPFVRVVALPKLPIGHYGVEDPYGILPDIPFVILAFLAPLACLRRPALRAFALCTAIASIATAALIFTFQFATNRYMVDFLPGFVILSVVGFWGLVEGFSGLSRKAAIGAGCFLLVWSVLFNVFASFNHNELLRVNDPEVFRRMTHFFGWPRQIRDEMTGQTYGPLELKLKFPANKTGKVEPLVVTGSEFLSDYLYAVYVSKDKIVIGFEHAGYGGAVTKPIPFDYSAPHRIMLDVPTLYPPTDDPYFDGVPSATREALENRLRVWLDGDEVIDTAQQFHPPFSTRPGIGGGAKDQGALGSRFTGEILRVRVLKPDWAALTKATRAGPLVISLEFPAHHEGSHEPLVCAGVPGKGDVLLVNYLDSNHVTFALDHWGYGGPVSGPVEIKPGTRQTLEVRFGSFFQESERPRDVPIPQWAAASEKLELILDGKNVFEVKTPFYEVAPQDVVIGRNPIGASSCVPEFGGRIFGSLRTDLK